MTQSATSKVLLMLSAAVLLNLSACDEDQVKAQYEIVIQTSNAYEDAAGKYNLVVLEMTGEDGTVTEPIQLNTMGDSNFKKGATNTFNIEAPNVGVPKIIRLELSEHRWKNPWGVQEVDITYNGQTAYFPIHDWVQDELNIPTGEGLIYHRVDNPYVLSILKREVESTKVLLPWVRRPGPNDNTRSLPRYVDAEDKAELPLIFQPTEPWTQSFSENSVVSGVIRATAYLLRKMVRLNSLESFHYLYHSFDEGRIQPQFLENDGWKTDEEFGRQQLNGIASMSMERCTKIPDSCQITSDHVTPTLLGGKTLKKEMKAGRIYMVDYTELTKDMKRNKNVQGQQLYGPNAICIFHVNSNGDLVPVAIQLVPGDPETIFTPTDSELDWLLAKMYFKVTFSVMHEWYHHFLLTHSVIEPFSVAVFRNLPRNHPVHKLLRGHLRATPYINLEARMTLIFGDSSANKAFAFEGEDVARRMFAKFSMNDLKIPYLMKQRGLDDEDLLPKFYYREDVKDLWNIIEKYVTTTLQYYYPGNKDIRNDKFLQDFIEDLALEGIGWDDEQNRRGLPYPLRTLSQLIDLVTTVIFTASVQHSAVNFQQYDQYKYVPNSPLAMRLPPHKRGEATIERIMDSLPDTVMSLLCVGISDALSSYPSDEVYLGEFPAELFTDKEAILAQEQFRMDLDSHDKKVEERNSRVEYPYDWLLREKIANSISI